MKKLFRVNTILVNGFDGRKDILCSHLISELENMNDEDEITMNDVQDADQVYLSYDKFENLGEITDDEIKTLIKFGII